MTKRIITILIITMFFAIIGVIFPVIAEETKTTANNSVTTKLSANTENITCVKAAVERRETAIQSALDNFYNSVKTALQTRKSDLSVAWTNSEKNARRTAIKTAWQNFKVSKNSAIQTFRKAKIAAWQQFKIDRKNCKASPTGEDQGADLSF